MPGRVEDRPGVLDTDHLVLRRMQDKQRSTQLMDPLALWLAGDVVEELLANVQPPPTGYHVGLAALFDLHARRAQQVPDVHGVSGSADR
jgi:hypothetical protein